MVRETRFFNARGAPEIRLSVARAISGSSLLTPEQHAGRSAE